MGPGREEENGRIAPMPDIKPGDVIVAKNPWGIGKFSSSLPSLSSSESPLLSESDASESLSTL